MCVSREKRMKHFPHFSHFHAVKETPKDNMRGNSPDDNWLYFCFGANKAQNSTCKLNFYSHRARNVFFPQRRKSSCLLGKLEFIELQISQSFEPFSLSRLTPLSTFNYQIYEFTSENALLSLSFVPKWILRIFVIQPPRD